MIASRSAGPAVMCAGLALLALAGCGGGSTAATHATHATHTTHATRSATAAQAPPPKDTALPQPSVRCGKPEQRAITLRFPAADGASLDGAIVGTGRIGVVLLHEYPGPMCGWWPYATYLAHHGLTAMLFDFRCFGLSACPHGGRGEPVADVKGAIKALRARGITSMALLGASFGGAVAVVAGSRLHPAAVVDLSGERDLTGLLPGAKLNAVAAASALHAPALFAVARDDRYVSVADTRAVYRRVGSATKRLTVLPASAGHGWDMLIGADFSWSPLAREVLAFIRDHAQATR